MLKIVLTGGASSGKTTVINRIEEAYKELGYHVIVVPETATELILSGIRPFGDNAIDLVRFQDFVLETQLRKEKVASLAAKEIGEGKTIIIYDRGVLDGYAYVKDKEWSVILKNESLTYGEALSRYDAVIYLESNPAFFTKENNAARYEADANDALMKAQRTLKGYLSHDNLFVVKSREKMDDKLNEVINIIHGLLGNPTVIKTQKKYLVDTIDIDKINVDMVRVDIEQVYLDYLQKEDEEHRIRKVTKDSSVTYHYNVQRKLENGNREIIREQLLKKGEYELLKENIRKKCDILNKIRYSFVYNDQYYKLDIFPDGLKILEVNVTKEKPLEEIPPFVRIIDDVTLKDEYYNIKIAGGQKEYGKRKVNSN